MLSFLSKYILNFIQVIISIYQIQISMANTTQISSVKSWEYTFDGLIFKVLPDKMLSLIALEVRHAETKEASFAVVDYKKNQALFHGLGLEENWWVGLTAFYEGKLFFHLFEGKEYPQPTGLLVANAFEQSLLWEKKGVYLEKVSKQGALVSLLKKEERTSLLLDTESGDELKQKDFTDFDSDEEEIIFPFQYAEGSDYFNMIAQFLKQKLKVAIHHRVDYLEYKNYIIISYWEQKKNCLVILDEKGELLFYDLLQENAGNQSEETFFLINNYSISIKHKHTILINELT